MTDIPSEIAINISSTPSPIRGSCRRRHSSPPCIKEMDGCQFDPDPNAWFNLMNIEVPHIQRICKWCMDSIQQTVDKARCYLFPADRYKRQLSIALDRLAQVEQELDKALVIQKTKTPEQIKQTSMCCPSCTQKEYKQRKQSLSETPKRAPKMVDNCVQTTPTGAPLVTPQNLSDKPPLPPPPPAAPPPPPPPPPVAPPPGKIKLGKGTSKKPPMGKMQKQDSLPRVTLQDLQNVKLRSSGRLKNKSPPAKSKSPSARRQSIAVFSQASINKDLKRAAEKSRTPNSISPEALALAMDRLPQEILSAHRKLRKVEVKRSPGGTPVVDKQSRRESGQGLTPMMTRALRKKFLLARSPSEQSPTKENQSSPRAKKGSRETMV